MDDLELVILDTVANVRELLRMSQREAEVLVRHAFQCLNPTCGVREWLDSEALAALALDTGIDPDRLAAMSRESYFATQATLRHQRALHGSLSPEQLRDAYRAGRDAVDAHVNYVRSQSDSSQ